MKRIYCFGALTLAFLFAAFPETVSKAAKEALSLCANHLVPSLFPFFVCANILVSQGFAEKAGRLFSPLTRKLFRVSGEGAAAIFLGFISGYPAGAVISGRLYREGCITKNEAERLLGFTNNPGPLFILGTVGVSLYQSKGAGLVLYSSVMLASLLSGVFMRFYNSENTAVHHRKTERQFDPMGDAVTTIMMLCGYVVFFAVLVAFLDIIGVLNGMCRLFQVLGIGEKTAAMLSVGIFEISTAAQKASGALPFMASLLSFGGMSVFVQTAAVIKKAGLNVKPYLIGKTVSSILSALICTLFLEFFPITIQTAQMTKGVIYVEYLGTAIIMTIGVYLFYRLLCKICP